LGKDAPKRRNAVRLSTECHFGIQKNGAQFDELFINLYPKKKKKYV